MDERRAPTNPLDTLSRVTDLSTEVAYLRGELPRAAKLLEKLSGREDPFSKMWVRYISGRVREAEESSEEAWKLHIDLRASIFPLAKGTIRIVKDGRMDTQMKRKEQRDLATKMAEIVSGSGINKTKKNTLDYYTREPFLDYAEYLLSTAGPRPSRIKPSAATTV